MPKKSLTPRQIMAGNIILFILAFAGFTFMAYVTVGAGA